MKRKYIYMAAGLLSGAIALSGCSAQMAPAAEPTPDAAQKTTAQPATAQPDKDAMTPDPSASAAAEETPGPIALYVGGEELSAHALEENDRLLLPLIEVAEVLGWSAEEESVSEETQTKRNIVLSKEDSRISVSWTVSDNTAEKITWQKDGLLIPVNTYLTTKNDMVYVPSAFFEEAMQVAVSRAEDGVSVSLPKEKATPDMREQTSQSSDE